MGATTAARPTPSLSHLWDYYNEILPIPDGTDFNTAAWSWASLVDVKLTRRELYILKRLYEAHAARSAAGDPPMQPATDDNVFKVFSALAKKG